MLSKYAMNTYDGCQSARAEVLREVSAIKRFPIVYLPDGISFWYAQNKDTIIFISAYPRKIETKDAEINFVLKALKAIEDEFGISVDKYHILYMDDDGCVDSVSIHNGAPRIIPGNQMQWNLFSHMLNSFQQKESH